MRILEKRRIDDDFAVKCNTPDSTTGILVGDHSLAENVQRVNLYPMDQFKEFMALMEKGMSEADVAAAYFVSPLIVRQGIKLARVAPELLEDYIAREMKLEQLEAFAITDDQERQSRVWASLRYIPYGQSLIRSNGILWRQVSKPPTGVLASSVWIVMPQPEAR